MRKIAAVVAAGIAALSFTTASAASAVPAETYVDMPAVSDTSRVMRSVMEVTPSLRIVPDRDCYTVRFVGSRKHVYVAYDNEYVFKHLKECKPSDSFGYAILQSPSTSTDKWGVSYVAAGVPDKCSVIKRKFANYPAVYTTLKKNELCFPG